MKNILWVPIFFLLAFQAHADTGEVLGTIDGLDSSGANTSIVGWACGKGLTTSIYVDLYLNGPSGTGQFFGRFVANQSSEPAVAQACGSTGTNYRFSIPLSPSVLQSNHGQGVYVHGISPTGLANYLLANSGRYVVPDTGEVLGVIDGLDGSGANTSIVGWACGKWLTTSIYVDLYLNGPAGTGQFIGRFVANQSSEPAVAQTCGSTGANHRYSIPLSPSVLQSNHGQRIYVHGISPTGLSNDLLSDSGMFVVPSPAQGPSLNVTASVHYNGSGFEKYLYSFPLPAGQSLWTGLSGVLTLQSLSNKLTQALISLTYLPAGSCPANGTRYSSYEAIRKDYPLLSMLQGFILKQPVTGTSQLPLDLRLASGMPMSGCVVLIMDGGPAAKATSGSASFVMSSSLTMTYSTPPVPAPGAYRIGISGEWCFGQNWGCEAATTDNSKTFYYAIAVPVRSQVLTLLGDLSHSSFDGTSDFGPIPTGAWATNSDVYVIPGGCGVFTPGVVSSPGNYYSMLPSNAIHFHSVQMRGIGVGVLQQPVFQEFSNFLVNAGDCFVYVIGMNGNGAIDAETQLGIVLQPEPAQ